MLASTSRVRPAVLAALFMIFLLFHVYISQNARYLSIISAGKGPYDTPPLIPKKLWYKLGPRGLNDKTRTWTDSCVKNNTGYKVEFMTDSSADAFVKDTFGTLHPELVQIYLGLSVPILKADILRYLLLFAQGGIYCDLDVACQAPIDDWIPPQYREHAAVVVGWEFDGGYDDNIVREFATWTIMARPLSPHMWSVIEDIVLSFRNMIREKMVPVEDLTMEMVGDVVDVTGPRRFTQSILKSMENSFNTTLHDIQQLVEPKLVGDILVLPGYAFATSTNRYDEGIMVPPPLVKHQYAGSWKNDKGGEMS